MGYKEVVSLLSKALNPSETIEIQQYILSLQKCISSFESENANLSKKIMDLETQIAHYDCWEKEKKKYEICQISGFTFYRLKKTTQLFCPICFNKDNVPIHLQPPFDEGGGILLCHNCKSKFRKNE